MAMIQHVFRPSDGVWLGRIVGQEEQFSLQPVVQFGHSVRLESPVNFLGSYSDAVAWLHQRAWCQDGPHLRPTLDHQRGLSGWCFWSQGDWALWMPARIGVLMPWAVPTPLADKGKTGLPACLLLINKNEGLVAGAAWAYQAFVSIHLSDAVLASGPNVKTAKTWQQAAALMVRHTQRRQEFQVQSSHARLSVMRQLQTMPMRLEQALLEFPQTRRALLSRNRSLAPASSL